MLQQFWTAAQCVFLIVSAAVGPYLPESSLHVFVLVLVVAAPLFPLACCIVNQWIRLAPPGQTGLPETVRTADTAYCAAPGGPGAPGTPMPRAPPRSLETYALNISRLEMIRVCTCMTHRRCAIHLAAPFLAR